MNIPAAKMFLIDVEHQLARANDLGATHLQLSTLDVAWLIEMARPYVETAERSRRGIMLLDQAAPVSRFESLDDPPEPIPAEVLEAIFREDADDFV